jgi:hypothetical protein
MPCNTGLGTIANRNRNSHVPAHEPHLVVSPMWRPCGDDRAINCRSDPTSLPTQGVDSCGMKSLSHFENFACPTALRRRVSCHQNIPSFTRLMFNATTPQHLSTDLIDSITTPPAVRVPPSPTCNSHGPTASAANASGFLLTALSNARINTCWSALSNLRASDKALTLFGR